MLILKQISKCEYFNVVNGHIESRKERKKKKNERQIDKKVLNKEKGGFPIK